MLYDAVTSLNALLSEFGTVVIVAVAFWIVFALLPMLRREPVRRSASEDVVRRFRLPSRGGRG